MKMDVRTMTSSAFECAEKYFLEINFPAPAPGAPLARVDELPALAGLEFVWSIALEVRIVYYLASSCHVP
jgi:hypothetical protein